MKLGLLGARSLGTKPGVGGVSSADRKAPNQGVRCNCAFQIGLNAHFLAGYFCSTRGFQKNPSIPALLGSGVPPPVYRYTSYVGGDAHFM
jgi:hypothetical protein